METWHFASSTPWPCSCSRCLHSQPMNPFPCTKQPPPPPRRQFSSPHCSHFPERFQGIIALTNHPLGSGAREIDAPSFQNNGGALWGASWCHNFSRWQAGQVYFGPGNGTGPMKIQSGQLNQSLYRVRWQRLWCKQPADMLNHIHRAEQTDSFYLENQASLSPRSWAMLHCLSVAISLRNFQSNKTEQTIKEINSETVKTKIAWKTCDKSQYINSILLLWLFLSLHTEVWRRWELSCLRLRDWVINYSCGRVEGYYKSPEFLNRERVGRASVELPSWFERIN